MKIFCEFCGKRIRASAHHNPYMCNCHEFIETFPVENYFTQERFECKGEKMDRRILFNNADDFERELFRSEFDSLFDTNSLVNKRRREQMENRI